MKIKVRVYLNVRNQRVQVPELSVLVFITTNEEQQFSYLATHERSLERHHVLA